MKIEAHTDCLWVSGYKPKLIEPVVPCPICNGVARKHNDGMTPVIWNEEESPHRWVCSGCNGTGRFEFYLARLIAGEIRKDGSPIGPEFVHWSNCRRMEDVEPGPHNCP